MNSVSKWEIERNSGALFYEPNKNYFEFSNGNTKRTFKTLYNGYYAVSLVSLFHNTIGINLKNEATVKSACFFPKLCTQADGEMNIQVALFGYEDDANKLQGLRWGVYDDEEQKEYTFEVEEDDVIARTFVHDVPTTNHPNSEKPYEMDAYARHFRVSLIRDDHRRIQKIALRYVSLLDPTTNLDEDKWAVTLVSTMNSTQGFFSKFIEGKVGHAMLACEGIKEGQPFFRYIHFRQVASSIGRIESFERIRPLENAINGPTWVRPRSLVQNMLNYVEQEKEIPHKFALYGSFFSQIPLIWSSFKYDFLELESADLAADLAEAAESETPRTCLQVAYEVAAQSGIIFQLDESFRKPIEKIEILKTAPILTIANGFDAKLLGKPFTGEHEVLAKKILSACVILLPEDCQPEDCMKWLMQTCIEETTATEKEIQRLENANFNELMKGFQFTPKRW